jgi:hypothetical protein
MHTCRQCKRIFDLFLEVQRFTCTDSHLQVTRPAECAACHGNGNAKQGKQCHKGKGKENVKGFHTLPVPSHWLHGAEVIPWNEFGFKFGLYEVLPYPSHSSHVSGSTAVGISISLGKSNFVIMLSWWFSVALATGETIA